MNPFIIRLQRFFLAPSPPQPLSFFRIGIAALGLAQGAWLAGSINLLYGAKGLVPWALSEGIVDPHIPQLAWLQPLATATGIRPDTWVYLLMCLYLCSLAGLLAGKFTRIMAFMAWALHLMFINTGFMAAYGVETFLHIALFYCILMPVSSVYAWDATRKPVADSGWNTLAIRVLQLHLCLVYVASGTEKAIGPQWWNGEAIWQTLMQGQFSRFDMHWLASYPWLAKFAGWSTLLIETCYPLFMFWRRSRPYGYLAVTGLHLSIALFMGLELFAAIMIIFNTTAFGWPYVQQAVSVMLAPWRRRQEIYRLRKAGEMATQAMCYTEGG